MHLIGSPIEAGPWYTDAIAFSHQGRIADCQLRFDGSIGSSDVIVRVGNQMHPSVPMLCCQAMRDDGWGGTILYNIFGPRRWRVLTCEAVVLESGGRTKRIDLERDSKQPGS